MFIGCPTVYGTSAPQPGMNSGPASESAESQPLDPQAVPLPEILSDGLIVRLPGVDVCLECCCSCSDYLQTLSAGHWQPLPCASEAHGQGRQGLVQQLPHSVWGGGCLPQPPAGVVARCSVCFPRFSSSPQSFCIKALRGL